MVLVVVACVLSVARVLSTLTPLCVSYHGQVLAVSSKLCCSAGPSFAFATLVCSSILCWRKALLVQSSGATNAGNTRAVQMITAFVVWSRGVDFLGAVLDVEYDDRTMTFNITSPGDALTLSTATGGVKQLLRSATPFTLPVQQVTLSA